MTGTISALACLGLDIVGQSDRTFGDASALAFGIRTDMFSVSLAFHVVPVPWVIAALAPRLVADDAIELHPL